MAINVNDVYRVVLAITNKEQRGYLTPDQFNRLARQAQMDLLEKSFYDYNRALTRRNMQGVNSEYGDIAEKIEEKIEALTASNFLDFGHADPDKGNVGSNEAWITSNTVGPIDQIYKILSISTNGSTGQGRTTQVERMKKSEFLYLNASKLTAPSLQFPAYYVEDSKVTIYPDGIQEATIDYVKVPASPKWGYTVVNGAYVYDGRTIATAQSEEGLGYTSNMGSTDFELHASEETALVVRILALTGIIIKDPTIIQVAQNDEAKEFNQQNS
jgi:uncharacterized membrane protein